jgi:hypothetical protein
VWNSRRHLRKIPFVPHASNTRIRSRIVNRSGRGWQRMKKIEVDMAGYEVSFEEAMDLAPMEAASSMGTSSGEMSVVAWYDRGTRRSSPEVGFTEGLVVNWEKSAAGLGADVWVEFGEESFVVLCGSSRKH